MSNNSPKRQLMLSNETQVIKIIKTINVENRDHVPILPMYINTLCSSEQTNPAGFRKIEPKPSEETVEDEHESEKKTTIGKCRGETFVRLGSNPTRRGVRLCVTCQGRIGYRSKTCKHCLKMPAMTNDLLSDTLLQRNENEKTDAVASLKINEGRESEENDRKGNEQKKNEHEENENVIHLPLSTDDHNYVQISYQKDENIIVPPSQLFCTTEPLPNIEKKLPKIQQDKDYVQNSVDFHYGNVTLGRQVGNDVMNEEQRDDQGRLNIKGEENLDKGNTYGNMCLLLKQEQNQDVSGSTTSQCHPSIETCTAECTPFEEDTISGIIMTGANDEKCPIQSGNKRKKEYPCQMNKKGKADDGIQFMRIEPKPYVGEEVDISKYFSIDTDTRPTSKRKNSGTADTCSFRFLPSNPTRRGIMSCPMCQKEVGCRSKTCKHCKVVINFNKNNALDYNNLPVVQLAVKTSQACAVFSVKKSTTPSEDRCFIRQAIDGKACKKEIKGSTHIFTWCCECNENNGFVESPVCEHARCFFRNPKIVQARTANLIVQKINSLPIDISFKNKLKQLWEKNKRRQLPLVQQVTHNTLVVLDIEKEISESLQDSTKCVHIRFEKIKRRQAMQLHIFCSGKSCSYWSSSESQGESPVTCLHYCISLWAIASDNHLLEYFKMFLEAAQVYLHSEVFESIVSS